MVEYAILDDVKSYLGINIASFDGKLKLILDGINQEIEDYTGELVTDSRLKLAACKWCEYHWNKTTGTKTEGDHDYSLSFAEDVIPLEVKQILDRYVDEDDEPGGIEVELI